MKQVAIVIGHRSKKQGAYSPFINETEYSYMKKVAHYLQDIADIYERPNTPFVSEATRIKQLVRSVNANSYKLVISLHFNGFHDAVAHGVTCLHYITNPRTKAIASEFVSLVNENFGIKKRALIPISSKNQRGGIFITGVNADAILVEPFFGSNPLDSENFRGKHQAYANTLRALINKYTR
ncbi:N-acetylmuramoyl-L-alanine amidase [Tenacibaculum sp. 190524A02b]|uniref:N-acetylmuramoyl-L-alanine amidase n=1 Tax=Tenacibaculum vairaonense TaxID=3137860 RepID=A0ABP1FCX0_9FLAO